MRCERANRPRPSITLEGGGGGTRRSSSPLQRPGWGRSHPFEASVPLIPQLLPLLGAFPTGNRVTAAGQKRGQAHSPARRRAAAGVGLRGRSDGRLGDWMGCERRGGDPARQRAADSPERTEPAGGRAALRTGKSSRRCNFHALICMSFAWSSRNGPATQPPRPLPPGTPASNLVQTVPTPDRPSQSHIAVVLLAFEFYFCIS